MLLFFQYFLVKKSYHYNGSLLFSKLIYIYCICIFVHLHVSLDHGVTEDLLHLLYTPRPMFLQHSADEYI